LQTLLDALLKLFKEQGWLKERGRQRTDSTHILAKVRAINRLMCVGEAMRFALNSLAVVASDWLLEHSDQAWLYRYGHRIEEGRFPRGQAERQAVAEMIGRDGFALLADVFDPASPAFLREIPAVEILRQIWIQNYHAACCRYGHRSNMKPSKPLASSRRPKSSPGNMHSDQVSKRLSPKAFVPLTCADHALSGSHAHICNMWQRLLLLTWSG